MPIAAFVPGGLIKSSDDNSNFSDIATALTQSLATTGVSTMTGPIKAAVGSIGAPGITFTTSLTTGFYLGGADQIGWAAAGVQSATFNSDGSVTWAKGATWGGTVAAGKGTIPIGSVMDFAGATAPSGWLLCFGQLVSTTTYAALFAQLSTTYGSGAGTFGIPDYRGRSTFGQDNMGGVAANRITNANSGIVGTTLGASGGIPNPTIVTGNLPPYTPTGSISVTQNAAQFLTNATATGGATTIGTPNPATITASFTGSAQGGSSTPFITIPPAIITNKIIYSGV